MIWFDAVGAVIGLCAFLLMGNVKSMYSLLVRQERAEEAAHGKVSAGTELAVAMFFFVKWLLRAVWMFSVVKGAYMIVGIFL